MATMSIVLHVSDSDKALITILRELIPRSTVVKHEGILPKTIYEFDSIGIGNFELYTGDITKLRNSLSKYNFTHSDEPTLLTGKVVGDNAMVVTRVLNMKLL